MNKLLKIMCSVLIVGFILCAAFIAIAIIIGLAIMKHMPDPQSALDQVYNLSKIFITCLLMAFSFNWVKAQI